MSRQWLLAAAALVLVSQTPKIACGSEPPSTCEVGASCGQFGTSVNFVNTPSEASRRAEKEEKLVLVLHLSGHFEDPKFT
jgi:hypothetical protein